MRDGRVRQIATDRNSPRHVKRLESAAQRLLPSPVSRSTKSARRPEDRGNESRRKTPLQVAGQLRAAASIEKGTESARSHAPQQLAPGPKSGRLDSSNCHATSKFATNKRRSRTPRDATQRRSNKPQRVARDDSPAGPRVGPSASGRDDRRVDNRRVDDRASPAQALRSLLGPNGNASAKRFRAPTERPRNTPYQRATRNATYTARNAEPNQSTPRPHKERLGRTRRYVGRRAC